MFSSVGFGVFGKGWVSGYFNIWVNTSLIYTLHKLSIYRSSLLHGQRNNEKFGCFSYRNCIQW